MGTEVTILEIAASFPSACLSEKIAPLRYGFEVVVKRYDAHVAWRLVLLVELRRG